MSELGKLLRAIIAVAPDAQAIEFDGLWWRWAEVRAIVDGIDDVLTALEMSSGTRVGVFLRNRPRALAALIGVLATDRCLVTINPTMPDDKLLADLAQLALPVVIAEARDLERAGMIEHFDRSGCTVIELTEDGGAIRVHRPGGADGTERIRHTAPGIVIEMLTSGTTGTPKRVAISAHGLGKSFASALSYEKGRSITDAPQLRDGTRLLTNPIAHIGGLWGALSAIAGGWRICLLERFTVDAWRAAVVRHRPKITAVVPAALRMVLDADVPAEDLASLVAIRTGTAPLDPLIVDEFLDRYDLPVLQTYGATEFAGAVAGWTLKDFRLLYREKRGSVGRMQPGVRARTVDAATGDTMPPDEEGLLELASPQLNEDGSWVRTTDRAILDGEGFLWIKGRSDNAIIRGGFKVHPDEVVRAIESHPEVREASVVGLADKRLGEVPVAAIVARTDMRVDPAELGRFLRQRLLPYQVPVSFKIVDDLPRTTSMKPDLAAVRALFAEAADPARAELGA